MGENACEDEVLALSAIYADDFLKIGENTFEVFHPALAFQIKDVITTGYPLENGPRLQLLDPAGKLPVDVIKKLNEQLRKEFEDKREQIIYSCVECHQWYRTLLADLAVPVPEIFHGEPVTDRKSKFQAHLAFVTCTEEVDAVMGELLQYKKVGDATHNISAYRISRDGTLVEGRDDDGETGAGDKVLYLMQRMGVINAVVVVSRWFGGIMLGPDRFLHISNVAKEIIEQRYPLQQGDSVTFADVPQKNRMPSPKSSPNGDVMLYTKQYEC